MSTVWTIGHGTRSTDELAALLAEHAIALLVDVRRHPGSARHPHLGRDQLEADLPDLGCAYEWWGEDLGGRRTRVQGSRHPAWRNASFRAYADYMDTPALRDALARLEATSAGTRLAIMCAETVWWRCHRRLIADALTVAGHEVIHIMGPAKTQPHPLHEAARRDEDGWVVYDLGVTPELDV